MPNCSIPELLTTRETAKVRKTTIGHLANERSRGLGPPVCRIGGRIFYPAEELAKFIRERITDPATRKAG